MTNEITLLTWDRWHLGESHLGFLLLSSVFVFQSQLSHFVLFDSVCVQLWGLMGSLQGDPRCGGVSGMELG